NLKTDIDGRENVGGKNQLFVRTCPVTPANSHFLVTESTWSASNRAGRIEKVRCFLLHVACRRVNSGCTARLTKLPAGSGIESYFTFLVEGFDHGLRCVHEDLDDRRGKPGQQAPEMDRAVVLQPRRFATSGRRP